MKNTALESPIQAFLEAYEGGDSNTIFTLRDRLKKRQKIVAIAEIIKKDVRRRNKEKPTFKQLGVSVHEIAPELFSDRDISEGLNHLIKNEGMELCYFAGNIGIKF